MNGRASKRIRQAAYRFEESDKYRRPLHQYVKQLKREYREVPYCRRKLVFINPSKRVLMMSHRFSREKLLEHFAWQLKVRKPIPLPLEHQWCLPYPGLRLRHCEVCGMMKDGKETSACLGKP